MYSSELLDHFERPRNSGELDNADAQVRIENPACGDILELSVRARQGVIREMRFRAKGCVPALACGSLVTELATGKTVEEAMDIRPEDVVRAIGGLPEASSHAAQLAIDGLQVLLRRLG